MILEKALSCYRAAKGFKFCNALFGFVSCCLGGVTESAAHVAINVKTGGVAHNSVPAILAVVGRRLASGDGQTVRAVLQRNFSRFL